MSKLETQTQITADRIEYGTPVAYRLKWYPRPAPSIEYMDGGELVLQGAYKWEEKNASGIEWRDIPTVIEGQE